MTQQAVTQAEFSRLLGVERSYITGLKKTDRLVMTADGLVDVEASKAKIAATADPAKTAVAERHAKNREGAVDGAKPPKIPGDELPEAGDEPAGTPDYQSARARREQANAQLAEMDVRQRAGDLFDAAEAIAVVADAGTVFRTALDSRRPLLVSQLAMMTDEAEIRVFLEEQDEQLLADLSARFDALGEAA